MKQFAGTWRLIRLILRRDRLRLPIWIIAIVSLVAVTVPALEGTYSTEEQRSTYAMTISSSVATRAFGGVIDGSQLGSIVMIESYLFTAVLVAFMSTTLIVRHTRQNEEMGSAELLSSAQLGRQAGLTAALLVVVGANILISVLCGFVLNQFDALSSEGAWGLAGLFAANGIVFASIAAVAAQLSQSSRGANALAGAAIGGAFLMRAIGDAFGTVIGPMSVESAWPTWLSPFGWGEQIYPFTQQHWWVFWLFVVTIIVGVLLSFMMASRRDIGAGILPARAGPKRASQYLRGSFGLAWRLQRTTLMWWLIVMIILGVMYGAMANELVSLVKSSDVLSQYISAIGGDGDIATSFLKGMMSLTGLLVLAYVVQSLLRLKTEESSGHLESVLSTATGRVRWILSHVFITGVGTGILMLVSGVATALTYIVVSGASWSTVGTFSAIAVVQLPALLVLIGLIVACFGLVPRFMAAISWFVFVFLMLLNQLGVLLKLPNWVMESSPFNHVPETPLTHGALEPTGLLCVIGVGLLLIGTIAFRRRDLTIE